MTNGMDDTAERLLRLWFDGVQAPGFEHFREAWFKADPELDAALRREFLPAHIHAAAGRLDHWATSARGALALILLLDQVPRNVFRGTPRAFATDGQALALARAMVAAGGDRQLSPLERLFVYLPFEHSESYADQERAVALIEALGDERSTWHAHHHRAIIARFGRFPHRNAVLGRTSTPEEVAWLASPEALY